MNTEAYLARIGCASRPEGGTYQTLAALQAAHLTNVPYETMDIVWRIPFSLDPDALFDKIVTRRRGGYCFELNGLFALLLRELGFSVTEYFGRFLRGAAPGMPMRRHRVLRVKTADAGDCIADVGVGGACPLMPLPLRDGAAVRDRGTVWSLRRSPELGWVIDEENAEGKEGYYAFTEEPQYPIDFVTTDFWCQNAPESPFLNFSIVSLQKQDGRVTLRGDELREYGKNTVRVIPAKEEAVRDDLLEKYFGIVHPKPCNPQTRIV